jgi:NAD(P)-dependent dehydrogenase (short-subunit alcohol dehydrogenase family)
MAEVGGGLDGLVNNAGIGVPGPLEGLAADDLREQLEVNVVGQVAVTQAALPLLRQAAGRIVFVGSVGGRLASQFAGPYHASKFAMQAIADVWRQELEPEEIAVVLVEPSTISTPIWDKATERLDSLLAGSDPRLGPLSGAPRELPRQPPESGRARQVAG